MQEKLYLDTATGQEQQFESDDIISRYECIILLLSLLALTVFFIIAAWSAILLFIGRTEGGGPLGMLMNVLQIQLLL